MQQNENDILQQVFKNNLDAVMCAKHIIYASQTLDDLWDKDKVVEGGEAVSMMLRMTVDLARNPFYRKHQDAMIRIVERAIMQWLEANDLEAEGDMEQLKISYIIRSSVTDAIIEMVYLLGNRQWGRAAAKEIRKYAYFSNESFDEYVKEHLKEE